MVNTVMNMFECECLVATVQLEIPHRSSRESSEPAKNCGEDVNRGDDLRSGLLVLEGLEFDRADAHID